jgi:DNA-binding HxlR family transcriptional regulator
MPKRRSGARLGEKWSTLVVMLLRDGPRRFNDIKRNTGGIPQQMLTRTLRGLERDGMGLSLSEPALAFGQWVHKHLAKIDAARNQFDQRAISEKAVE